MTAPARDWLRPMRARSATEPHPVSTPLVVWLLQLRPPLRGPVRFAGPAVAVLVLLAPLLPAPLEVLAGLLVLLVAVNATAGRPTPERVE